MTAGNRLKQRLMAICQPKPGPWKRVILWVMSLSVALVCMVSAWVQLQDPSTDYLAWGLIGLFGIGSIAGIITAAVGDDVWVALFISDVD